MHVAGDAARAGGGPACLRGAPINSGTTDPTPASQAFTIDTIRPQVSLSSPVAGATVAGSITVGATATDAGGVTGAKWFVDSVEVASDYDGAPWSRSWNSASVPDGSHSVHAKARDPAGNWGTSAKVTITVDNVAG